MIKTVQFASCVLAVTIAIQFSTSSIAATAANSPAKIKVLLVDGQNNHDWKRCGPVMKDTLEATGRFVVDRISATKDKVDAVVRTGDPGLTKWSFVNRSIQSLRDYLPNFFR